MAPAIRAELLKHFTWDLEGILREAGADDEVEGFALLFRRDGAERSLVSLVAYVGVVPVLAAYVFDRRRHGESVLTQQRIVSGRQIGVARVVCEDALGELWPELRNDRRPLLAPGKRVRAQIVDVAGRIHGAWPERIEIGAVGMARQARLARQLGGPLVVGGVAERDDPLIVRAYRRRVVIAVGFGVGGQVDRVVVHHGSGHTVLLGPRSIVQPLHRRVFRGAEIVPQTEAVADFVHRHPKGDLIYELLRHRFTRLDFAARRKEGAHEGPVRLYVGGEARKLSAHGRPLQLFRARVERHLEHGRRAHQAAPVVLEVEQKLRLEKQIGVDDLARPRIHDGRPDSTVAVLVRDVPAKRRVTDVFRIGILGQHLAANGIFPARLLEGFVPGVDPIDHRLPVFLRDVAVDVIDNRLFRPPQIAYSLRRLEPPPPSIAYEVRAVGPREVLLSRQEIAHPIVRDPRLHRFFGQLCKRGMNRHRQIALIRNGATESRAGRLESQLGAEVHVLREAFDRLQIAEVLVEVRASRLAGLPRDGEPNPLTDLG